MTATRNRHWRQRWDPNAPLVFRKRLRMGDDPAKPYVFPGDPVTDAHRAQLGMARLKVWWESGTIERADFDPNLPGGGQVVHEAAPVAGIESTGRGWFTVTFADGTTKRVRGEENAKMELALRVNTAALRAALGA